jgi:transcriptional regulator with XRE-family HTH domain
MRLPGRADLAHLHRIMTDVPHLTAVFSLAVVRAREHKGWTQGELARASGLDRVTVANIERGASLGAISTLYRLSCALDVTPNELLGVTDGNSSQST